MVLLFFDGSCVRRTKIKNLKAIHNDYNSTCLAAFRTGEGLLRYGICVPCSKRLPLVRDAFSEALRAQNRLLGYRMYRERPPGVPNEAEERGSGSEIGDFAKNSHLVIGRPGLTEPKGMKL